MQVDRQFELAVNRRIRDGVTVNNELGELFISPLLPVFREVGHQMDCRLIDF